ncbi:MAG: GNAT family N-acetyltransferase [Myxococcota bacterium]
MSQALRATAGFSEKEFYLAEFRGRSLGVVLADAKPAQAGDAGVLRGVLDDLEGNATSCVLIGADRRRLAGVAGRGKVAVVDARDPRWVGAVWRGMQRARVVCLLAPGAASLAACVRRAAARLRLAKVVWLDAEGGLERPAGGRISHVDQAELAELVARDARRAERLGDIAAMLEDGLPSAAICAPSGLADELFTFAGSGTFFTREGYIEVRPLGLDEFDAGHDLIRRGVAEGYLVPRSEAALEEVITNAFGVFVERRYLAGIGALLPHAKENAGELGSLYTLTRFAGEGVGGHLVRYALDAARREGFAYVYACTTQPRVVGFFETNGFARVDPSRVPAEKWDGYPDERRAQVTCLRCDLA